MFHVEQFRGLDPSAPPLCSTWNTISLRIHYPVPPIQPMPFTSGRVSYSRFRVTPRGDTFTSIDEALLDRLREGKFQASEIGVPEEAEVGWTTGEHLFDTDFSYEKNGFGQPGSAMLHVALRIDTHRVPADIKRAYQKMNERAAAAGNPSGFASKEQKREAKDETQEQLARELADGRHRKSKSVPVFWDMERGVVHAAATSQAVAEHLQRMLRHTFDVDVEPITAGSLAGHHLGEAGKQRDYEDLRPSPFTPPTPCRACGRGRRDRRASDRPEYPAVPLDRNRGGYERLSR